MTDFTPIRTRRASRILAGIMVACIVVAFFMIVEINQKESEAINSPSFMMHIIVLPI